MSNHPNAILSFFALSGAVYVAAFATQGCSSPGGVSLVPNTPPPPGSVVMYHNDLMRTGHNGSETLLNRSNVNPATFGKVGALAVDGLVYAQPLYLQNIAHAGGKTRNLVFIATEHDSVYAFDADTLSNTPVWRHNFIGDKDSSLGAADQTQPCNGCGTLSVADINAPNLYPESGITSTPVIDPVNGILYVVATSKENGIFYEKIHMLSLENGTEISPSPVAISASAPGEGFGSVGPGGSITAKNQVSLKATARAMATGAENATSMDPNELATHVPTIRSRTQSSAVSNVVYDAQRQLSRSGLVLSNGMLYVALSSYNDQEPAHGWLLAYDPLSLQQTGVFISTPNSGDGNIWMAGGAPVVDRDGSLFFATGNGDPASLVADDFADLDDSVLKVGWSSGGFGLLDWFMPYNRPALALGDVDLGSGGVLALPDQPGNHPHLLLAGGKQGTLYLIDRDAMTAGNIHVNSANGATSDPEIVQELQNELPGGKNGGPGIYGTPSYFNGHIYIAGSGDYLRSYPMLNGQIDTAHMTKSKEQIAKRGCTASISSNSGNEGIVWTIDASNYAYSWTNGSPDVKITANGPSVLYAYNADDLSKPLYRSDLATSDAAGNAVKFAVPTVADGKVFVGTQKEVSVYGLK